MLVVTRRLAHAGSVLGTALLDHVVWTRDAAHTSIRELEPETFSQPATS